MTTKMMTNEAYTAIAEEFPLVAASLKECKEFKIDLAHITEEQEKLMNEEVTITESLAVADDTLFKLATMAQDQIDAIEKVKAEHKEDLNSQNHNRCAAVDVVMGKIIDLSKEGDLHDGEVIDAAKEILDILKPGSVADEYDLVT